MTGTQPSRRNHSCWKVCAQVWLGNVEENDESESPVGTVLYGHRDLVES